MLAIGRALMTNPRLLILDEATEGLAPLIRAEIYRSIERLKADGLSILVIDKDVKALTRVADRHYVLEKGRVVWSGTLGRARGERQRPAPLSRGVDFLLWEISPRLKSLIARWDELCRDPSLAGPALQDRAERVGQGRDEPGERSPRRGSRASRRWQFEAAAARRPAITECPILTSIGIRVPDVAWASAQFMQAVRRYHALPARARDLRRGPSPSNVAGRNRGEDARLSRRRRAGGLARRRGRQRSATSTCAGEAAAQRASRSTRHASRPTRGYP